MACCFQTAALPSRVASRRLAPSRSRAAPARAAQRGAEGAGAPPSGRRELLLQSSSVASTLVLASLLHFSGERPSSLGLQTFGKSSTLGLCPRTPNCISTAEELNDPDHFVPPWTYNSEELRVRKGKEPLTREQAMAQLADAVANTSPDGFTPTIVKRTESYLYATYASPLFGFVDDVEFYFPDGPGDRVEYRSASRLGQSDGDVNRKRIRALREVLQKKGWRSVGY